jgi:hypothetical protein
MWPLAASSPSLLPVRMQTPVASIENVDSGQLGYGDLFKLQRQFRLLFLESGQSNKNYNLE